MEIKKEPLGDKTVLRVAGELDFSNAEILQKEMAGQPVGTLEIDLSGLTFLDSTGVGVLLNAAKDLASQGRILKVVNIPGEIRESMELVGFFQVMDALYPKSRGRRQEVGSQNS